MGNMVLSLVIDILMAGLLIVTLFYCSRLNKRIRLLQDAKSELAHIIQEFDESTQRATQSIAQIHEATNRISENIQHKIDKANFLADDLQFLIERSAKITDHKGEGAAARPAPARAAEASRHRAASVQEPSPAASPETGEKRRAGLRMRSKAEQELLDALKNNE